MPEPFKNFSNKTIICGMAMHFHKQWPEFDSKDFTRSASKNLDSLGLKARSDQITNTMISYLPDNFKHAEKIILASLFSLLMSESKASHPEPE